MAEAKTSAKLGAVVTFGIKPVRPETGYGYIETGQKLLDADGFAVAGFHEKPDEDSAKKMIEKGGYLWNSGIFLMQCKIVLKLAEQHVPGMLRSVRQSLKLGKLDLCLLYTSPSPRDGLLSRMPSSA